MSPRFGGACAHATLVPRVKRQARCFVYPLDTRLHALGTRSVPVGPEGYGQLVLTSTLGYVTHHPYIPKIRRSSGGGIPSIGRPNQQNRRDSLNMGYLKIVKTYIYIYIKNRVHFWLPTKSRPKKSPQSTHTYTAADGGKSPPLQCLWRAWQASCMGVGHFSRYPKRTAVNGNED